MGLLVVIALGACPKDNNDAQLMPRLPPQEPAVIPNDLRIAVTIDGAAAAPIDHQRLAARPPDYKDPEHQAWRIAPLLGVTDKDASIVVVGERGLTMSLPQADHLGEPEPVLFLTRRSEVTAALVLPSNPFPGFHRNGRQLGRAGDPLPRLAGRVLEIRVTSP